jgi:hypothetical protein|tara:strand:+ start:459 stop:560 length:102 start_codon:yes stop_codon:yes gene_type:complete
VPHHQNHAADISGNLLADEEKLGAFKCEGIEFV